MCLCRSGMTVITWWWFHPYHPVRLRERAMRLTCGPKRRDWRELSLEVQTEPLEPRNTVVSGGRFLISVCIFCYLSRAAIIAIEVWEWISNFIRHFYKICYYGMISWSPVEFKRGSRKYPGMLTLGYELLSNVRTNVISTICVFLPCHVYVSFPDPSVPQTVPYSRTQLTCLVGPADVTTDGICRAGVLLHLIDECAGVVAAKHCATKIATVSFDAINFRHRIKKGKASSITGRLRFR